MKRNVNVLMFHEYTLYIVLFILSFVIALIDVFQNL